MSELTITDQRLKPVAEKVLAGGRLGVEDGIALYRSPDLLAVGWLANHVREKKHGKVTYFNVNRHINPTNMCVAHCKLCAFGRDPSAPGAYNFSLEEIYARAEQGAREGALEFHIVGGLHLREALGGFAVAGIRIRVGFFDQPTMRCLHRGCNSSAVTSPTRRV